MQVIYAVEVSVSPIPVDPLTMRMDELQNITFLRRIHAVLICLMMDISKDTGKDTSIN